MKKLTIALATVILLMTGCASVDTTDQSIANLSQKVDELSSKINKLKDQQEKNSESIEKVKAMTEQLASDSQSTNEKIDNIIASYKK